MHGIEGKDGKVLVMKFQKIKNIELKYQNKLWVIVEFENGTIWMPALIDLAKIISKIGICEDIKYPLGKGKDYTKNFVITSIDANGDDSQIEFIYKNYFDPNNLKNRKAVNQ